MGTSGFAVAALKALYTNFATTDSFTVITQPDKPQGRGYKEAFTPVKKFAIENEIPVFQPQSLKRDFFENTLTQIDPDIIIVASYGKILPKYILDYPKYSCINIHASLLPKYRGAAPINRCIMNGEEKSGISLMYMSEGLDQGDIIEQREIIIEPHFDAGILHDMLSNLGGEMIVSAINKIKNGETLSRKTQDHALATYAEKITNDDRLINWSENADNIINKIRGLSPITSAYTFIKAQNKMLKVHSAVKSDMKAGTEFGEVISDDKKIVIKCKDGSVQITSLQIEGAKKMSALDFLNGRKIKKGDILQ